MKTIMAVAINTQRKPAMADTEAPISGPGDVAQIHKRLVIAKDTPGDAVAAVLQQ